jgi:hypothetical protein
MRNLLAIALTLALGGCALPAPPQSVSGAPPLVAAEQLIDAYYSFDPQRMRAALVDAPGSRPAILFYQGWAQGGNYAVLERTPCQFVSETEVACAITVRDDLIAALGTGFWVTDTFHLTIEDGRIVKVRTSSNDPPEFGQALSAIQRERPDIMAGPCQGFFAGGPTPGDCVRAVVAEFARFRGPEK